MSAVEAIIFDMDGLILDTERIALKVCQQVAADLTLDIPDTVFFSMIGMRKESCQAILEDALEGDPAWKTLWDEADRAYHSIIREGGVPLKDGVEDVLDYVEVQGYKWGIGTSSESSLARSKLGPHGIDVRVPTMVCGDQVSQGKPAPEVFLKVAQSLGVSPETCIVLEDSGPGIEAAAAAGMRPVLIPDLQMPSQATQELAFKTYLSLPLFLEDFKTWTP